MPSSPHSERAPSFGPTESRKAISWITWLLLAAVAVLVPFYKLGDFRSLGSHEVYAAVPAREMLQSGNWIVPRFGGLPRLEKPPLAYWVVATSASLFGGVNDWSIRVPAALCAVILSAVMGIWGWRWYGRVAGFGAALVQISSVYAVTFARKAEVDMLLCLLTTISMFLIAGHVDRESGRKSFVRWTAIYSLLSLAWLAKFHYGPVMVLAPTAIYFVVERRYKSLLWLANPLGLALLAAAVVVWPYLLLQHVPNAWEVWKAQTVGRAVGDLGHEPIWFYVPNMLWIALPWTPFALAAIPESFRRAWLRGPEREKHSGLPLWKQGDSRERFLWVWFLVVFGIVTVSANKHTHYLMAALPVFSLLAGRSLSALVRRLSLGHEPFSRRSAVALATIFLIAGLGISIGVRLTWSDLAVPASLIGGILVVGGWTAVALLKKGRLTGALNTTLLVFLSCYIGIIGWIVPGQDHRFSTVEFAEEIRRDLPPDTSIGVYRVHMSSIVYYLNDPVYRVETLESLPEQLGRNGKLLLVTFESRLPELAGVGEERVIKRLKDENDPDEKCEPLVFLELRTPKMASNGNAHRKD